MTGACLELKEPSNLGGLILLKQRNVFMAGFDATNIHIKLITLFYRAFLESVLTIVFL